MSTMTWLLFGVVGLWAAFLSYAGWALIQTVNERSDALSKEPNQ